MPCHLPIVTPQACRPDHRDALANHGAKIPGFEPHLPLAGNCCRDADAEIRGKHETRLEPFVKAPLGVPWGRLPTPPIPAGCFSRMGLIDSVTRMLESSQ